MESEDSADSEPTVEGMTDEEIRNHKVDKSTWRNGVPRGLTLMDIGIRDSKSVRRTIFGKMRKLHTLNKKDKVFLVLATMTLLTLVPITIHRMNSNDKGFADFTFGIILLLNMVFFLFYVVSGVLFERIYALILLLICTIVIWIYCVLNYSLSEKGIYKMARLIAVSAVSPFMLIIGGLVVRSSYLTRSLVFRTVGGNLLMQERVRALFLHLSLLYADLQVSLTMALCVMHKGIHLDLTAKIFLSLGIVYSLACFIIGYLSVRLENGKLVVAFLSILVLMPAYSIYLVVEAVMRINQTRSQQESGLLGVLFMASLISLTVRFGLLFVAYRTYLNFGQGLKICVFTGKDHEDLQNIKEAEEERLRQEYVKEQEQARLERQQARLLKLSENNQSGKQDDQEPIKLSENNQSGLQDDHAPIKLNENNALKPVC